MLIENDPFALSDFYLCNTQLIQFYKNATYLKSVFFFSLVMAYII